MNYVIENEINGTLSWIRNLERHIEKVISSYSYMNLSNRNVVHELLSTVSPIRIMFSEYLLAKDMDNRFKLKESIWKQICLTEQIFEKLTMEHRNEKMVMDFWLYLYEVQYRVHYCKRSHYFGIKHPSFIKFERTLSQTFIEYSQAFITIYTENGLTRSLCGHDSQARNPAVSIAGSAHEAIIPPLHVKPSF